MPEVPPDPQVMAEEGTNRVEATSADVVLDDDALSDIATSVGVGESAVDEGREHIYQGCTDVVPLLNDGSGPSRTMTSELSSTQDSPVHPGPSTAGYGDLPNPRVGHMTLRKSNVYGEFSSMKNALISGALGSSFGSIIGIKNALRLCLHFQAFKYARSLFPNFPKFFEASFMKRFLPCCIHT